MMSVAISKPTSPRIFRTSTETMLSDRQSVLLERFAGRCIRSRRKREIFVLDVRSRLGPGRPGDGAVEMAMALAAAGVGVPQAMVERFGLQFEARGIGRGGGGEIKGLHKVHPGER
jgi:hypothetical protein